MLKELHNKLTKESEQIKQEKAEQRQRKVVSFTNFVAFPSNQGIPGRNFERDVCTFRCRVIDPFSNCSIP